jgi:hypothetical protein
MYGLVHSMINTKYQNFTQIRVLHLQMTSVCISAKDVSLIPVGVLCHIISDSLSVTCSRLVVF